MLPAYGGKRTDEPMRENNGAHIVLSGQDEDTRQVAVVTFRGNAKRGQTYSAPDPEGLANAKLIAAAPVLLEVLTEIQAHIETPADKTNRDGIWHAQGAALFRKANAAIAKARS